MVLAICETDIKTQNNLNAAWDFKLLLSMVGMLPLKDDLHFPQYTGKNNPETNMLVEYFIENHTEK